MGNNKFIKQCLINIYELVFRVFWNIQAAICSIRSLRQFNSKIWVKVFHELASIVTVLEKKKGKSNEVNDSQSMYQAPDSRMGPNKYR